MSKANKGAIPKVKKPFTRSTKTPRTPPKQTEGDEESQYYQCQACFIRTEEGIVQCDSCQLWFHFSCANVTSDVKDYEWMCTKCRVPNPIIIPSGEEDPSRSQQLLAKDQTRVDGLMDRLK